MPFVSWLNSDSLHPVSFTFWSSDSWLGCVLATLTFLMRLETVLLALAAVEQLRDCLLSQPLGSPAVAAALPGIFCNFDFQWQLEC